MNNTANQSPTRSIEEHDFLCMNYLPPIGTFTNLGIGDDPLLNASKSWWMKFTTKAFDLLDAGIHSSLVVTLPRYADFEVRCTKAILDPVFVSDFMIDILHKHLDFMADFHRVSKDNQGLITDELTEALDCLKVLEDKMLNDHLASRLNHETIKEMYRKIMRVHHLIYTLTQKED